MRDLIRQITSAYGSTKLEGQEGGAVVFSGQEPDTKQPVRIQVLPRLLGDDPQITARFRKLAQTIRQLNHPNIASIRAVGEKAGLPYIVTRAVERAQPLVAKLDRPWAVDDAADLVMQAGQALEYAEKKGLVHGSLSPQDILVQDDGRVQVTGFGVNGLIDLLGVQLKQAASPYLAPERVAGKPADARADVYALAAILYGLVARRPPQVVKGQVLPPGRFNPDVPPDMDKVIVKALAPSPEERYPDTASFLAALGAVMLSPAKTQTPAEAQRCPRCGTANQAGRFCRKCGAPLAQPTPTTALPVALVVGEIQTGKGIGEQATLPMPPAAATAGEFAVEFPAPLPMPQLNMENVWAELADATRRTMPKPPPMPVIDWAEPAATTPKVLDAKTEQDPQGTGLRRPGPGTPVPGR